MIRHEPHPLSTLLPPMTDHEYCALRDDISANGLIHPILLFEDKTLDGNNRERACEETGVEPRYEVFTGDYAAARARVLSGIRHRHLTPSQSALIAGRLATTSHGGDRKSDHARKSGLEAMTIKQAAAQVSINEDTARKGYVVVQSGDFELIAKVERKDKSINWVYKEVRAKKPKKEQTKKREEAAATKPVPTPEQLGNIVEAAGGLDPAGGGEYHASPAEPVGAPSPVERAGHGPAPTPEQLDNKLGPEAGLNPAGGAEQQRTDEEQVSAGSAVEEPGFGLTPITHLEQTIHEEPAPSNQVIEEPRVAWHVTDDPAVLPPAPWADKRAPSKVDFVPLECVAQIVRQLSPDDMTESETTGWGRIRRDLLELRSLLGPDISEVAPSHHRSIISLRMWMTSSPWPRRQTPILVQPTEPSLCSIAAVAPSSAGRNSPVQ